MDDFFKDMRPFFHRRALIYVDVGAHHGMAYQSLAEAGFDILEAHLIEPDPQNFEALTVLQGGEGSRVVLHNFASGRGPGSARLRSAGALSRIVTADEDGNCDPLLVEVDVVSLDTLSQSFASKHISILKIDVETYDEEVLAGAHELLSQGRVDVVYVEAGIDQASAQNSYYRRIEDLLNGYDYGLFRIYEQHGEWIEDDPLMRRLNLAFMSRSFAEKNPYRLVNELYAARNQVEDISERMHSADAAREDALASIRVLEEQVKHYNEADWERKFVKADAERITLRAKLEETQQRERTLLEQTSELKSATEQVSNLEKSLKKSFDKFEEERTGFVAELTRRKEKVQSLESQLAELNEAHEKLSNEVEASRNAATKSEAKRERLEAELADERNSLMTREKEAEANARTAFSEEHERKKLERQLAQEREQYADKLAEYEKAYQKLKTSVTSPLLRERDSFVSYADQLERQYLAVLHSRSWRLMRPVRVVLRKGRGWFGKPNHPNRLPKRPGATPSKQFASLFEGEQLAAGSAARKANGRSSGSANGVERPQPTNIAKSKNDSPPRVASNPLPSSKPAGEDVDPLISLRTYVPANEDALKKEYARKGLDREDDTFVLYRIIGNDLVPRHRKGQSRDNVRFILENEPELENCEKRWIVNRIFDAEEERHIVELLDRHHQDYTVIPFDYQVYKHIEWDESTLPSEGFLNSKEFSKMQGEEQRMRARTATYRLKNIYVMNNNGARNTALEGGKRRAKWVLPWDGNCFLTKQAWSEIREAVGARPHLKYFAVPMDRAASNDVLKNDGYVPNAVEEPQIIFRRDTTERFNEAFPYGRRPKVEMFWRLGMPGKWDRYRYDPWDVHGREPSEDAGAFGMAGWVARLFSGMADLEQTSMKSFKARGIVRQEAIMETIDLVDRLTGRRAILPALQIYSIGFLNRLRASLRDGADDGLERYARAIVTAAEDAIGRGPFSVVDKTSLPPSGDIHDYWHPAPYWHPNPNTANQLPYVRKDGVRVEGTQLYEESSDQYDRTRVQRLFDDTTTLVFAHHLTGERRYAQRAAENVRRWFADPETRMSPHLTYSQVRRGHNKDLGQARGIIELKDLYYFLDAVRLVIHTGELAIEDERAFRDWLKEYADWLESSPQGEKERDGNNNHGTYFDVQIASIYAYLGNRDKLRETLTRSLARLPVQIDEEGVQEEELNRPTSAHYCCFNLQGWVTLLNIYRAYGMDVGSFGQRPLSLLQAAIQWLLEKDLANWPYQQIDAFDNERGAPIAHFAKALGIDVPAAYQNVDTLDYKMLYDPHDGIAPYWQTAGVRCELDAKTVDLDMARRELHKNARANAPSTTH
ncbi:FkbM family methyltransferase [Pararhizobium mangrovi]|nr:FkbM family methyltransferase [Pararhizobium mangrovi]